VKKERIASTLSRPTFTFSLQKKEMDLRLNLSLDPVWAKLNLEDDCEENLFLRYLRGTLKGQG
jgi:hypothetical protein